MPAPQSMLMRSPASAVLAGGVTLATIDLVYVCSFWFLLRGVSPAYILQYIASGALGPAAFDGGVATALAGAGFHYAIATAMVLAYYLASCRFPELARQPLRHGLPYGVLLWAVMTHVVVPLSLAEPPARPYVPALVTNFLMHLLFGVVCAWFSRLASGARR